ncbi:hypothetical protein ACP70R_016074 [Stipagrostis hirtigluma subsp. patula]
MDHHAKRPRPSPPWADLPGDALGEIAGRLHDAADFVRFHAVCRPWREAAPPPPRSFLPCLIKLDDGSLDTGALLHLHSPFARKTRRPASSWAVAALRGKILECLDVAGGRVLALGCSNDGDRTAMLINPLTGDATSLPPLPENISPRDAWPYPSGVISNNGLIVLHTFPSSAVLLRPGETDWEDVDISCATDMDLCSDRFVRRVTVLCSSGVLQGGTRAMAKLPERQHGRQRYVLESQGELLCIDAQEMHLCLQGQTGGTLPLAVSVHALEVHGDDGSPQWVEREHGRGIDHMCLFLDWMSSSGFAVDAREFTGAEVSGGSAYFVGYQNRGSVYGVYRYNFKDGTAAIMDELPLPFIGRPCGTCLGQGYLIAWTTTQSTLVRRRHGPTSPATRSARSPAACTTLPTLCASMPCAGRGARLRRRRRVASSRASSNWTMAHWTPVPCCTSTRRSLGRLGGRPASSWAVAALRGKILECLNVAGGRVLAVGCSHDGDRTAMLINPLTGDATSLPPLPENISPRDAWQYPSGVISNNGLIVLHTIPSTAVLLRPGETNWEDVDISCAMDMDLCSDKFVRRVTVLCSSGVLQGGTRAMAKLPQGLPEGHRYVLESQGELLYIDVHEIQAICLEGGQLGKLYLAVSVHALEVRNDGRPQWVERDHGRGIDHMCLFLGWRSSSSFAIDAREFAGAKVTGDGGCAFLVAGYQNGGSMCGVYRYTFMGRKTEVMDELLAPFNRTSMWYMPQPRISHVLSRLHDF